MRRKLRSVVVDGDVNQAWRLVTAVALSLSLLLLVLVATVAPFVTAAGICALGAGLAFGLSLGE